jgi:hypothetical protein
MTHSFGLMLYFDTQTYVAFCWYKENFDIHVRKSPIPPYQDRIA